MYFWFEGPWVNGSAKTDLENRHLFHSGSRSHERFVVNETVAILDSLSLDAACTAILNGSICAD